MNIKFESNLENNYKLGFLTIYVYGCDIDTLIKCFQYQKEKIINEYPNAYCLKFEFDHEQGQPQISFVLPKTKDELAEDEKVKKHMLKEKIEKAKQLLKENGVNL